MANIITVKFQPDGDGDLKKAINAIDDGVTGGLGQYVWKNRKKIKKTLREDEMNL